MIRHKGIKILLTYFLVLPTLLTIHLAAVEKPLSAVAVALGYFVSISFSIFFSVQLDHHRLRLYSTSATSRLLYKIPSVFGKPPVLFR